MTKKPRILFLFLKAFTATGGIEKVNRTVLRALADYEAEGQAEVRAVSPYGQKNDPRYFPGEKLSGYNGDRWRFMLAMLFWKHPVDTLLVSHINLAPAVWVLKKRFPRMRVLLIAHGIEVWYPVSRIKSWLLHAADTILAVSRYTADTIHAVHGVPEARLAVLPNCLDPFFQPPADLSRPAYLTERYGLRPEQPLLLTITRLNSNEGYKGYDKVIQALPALRERFPDIRYLLAGKYDVPEKARLDAVIQELELSEYVLMPGFVADEELIDHYRLASVFVMPSKKEGFGLVFIEAMACGTPAIGGNKDGSVEALADLGTGVDPDQTDAIRDAITAALQSNLKTLPLQENTLKRFAFTTYKAQLRKYLNRKG